MSKSHRSRALRQDWPLMKSASLSSHLFPRLSHSVSSVLFSTFSYERIFFSLKSLKIYLIWYSCGKFKTYEGWRSNVRFSTSQGIIEGSEEGGRAPTQTVPAPRPVWAPVEFNRSVLLYLLFYNKIVEPVKQKAWNHILEAYMYVLSTKVTCVWDFFKKF